ncbi:MAG: glycosyltransferase [Bacilli bacterium]|nr:glycosyltransferase [Bacilli bacterium]
MELFNNVIWWVNIAIIVLFGGLFLFQFLFMFLCFLKPRKYPEAKNIHHFTIVIRAHDEEDVIADSVKSSLKVDYPKDKFNVIVFAHNCKDNTAKIARELGARVVEVNDADICKPSLGTNMKHGLDTLKKEGYKTEYFVLIDADNQIDKNYLNACNKAADDGVAVGRTFENSRNLTDNVISCMSGLWYIRDSRIACVGRSALRFGCVMNGPTSMIRSDLAFNWDALSNSEDLEFTLNRLIKDKMIVEYIDEAVLYEDQPTTMDDIFKRNSRMGGGLNKLFWTRGIQCLGHFFKNLFKKDIPFGTKLSYLDQYSNIAIIPGSFVACIWFPFYYIYSLVYTGIVGPMNIWGLGVFDLRWFVIFIVIVLCAALFVPFWFQPAISYIAERKRLFISNKKVVLISVIFFPAFMIIEAVAVIKGILLKSKWSKIKRSHTTIKQ